MTISVFRCVFLLVVMVLPAATAEAQQSQPQRFEFSVRASELDPRVQAHPEIGFVLEKNGMWSGPPSIPEFSPVVVWWSG